MTTMNKLPKDNVNGILPTRRRPTVGHSSTARRGILVVGNPLRLCLVVVLLVAAATLLLDANRNLLTTKRATTSHNEKDPISLALRVKPNNNNKTTLHVSTKRNNNNRNDHPKKSGAVSTTIHNDKKTNNQASSPTSPTAHPLALADDTTQSPNLSLDSTFRPMEDPSEDEDEDKEDDPKAQKKTNPDEEQQLPHLFHRLHPQRPSLHLIGERHSGTNWIADHLIDCFASQVDFRKRFSQWKHWFQDEASGHDLANNETEAVVIAQFRNVFQFVKSMQRHPHHAPDHFNLPWHDFITKPWTMKRYGPDVAFVNATVTHGPHVSCPNMPRQKPYQIIPCVANRTFVLDCHTYRRKNVRVTAYYELQQDGSGRPYDNLLELRAAKIHNFLQVQHYKVVKAFYPTRYEDLVRHGTGPLLRQLERDLGVTATCRPLPAQPAQVSRHFLPPAIIQHIQDHTDWEAEALIGYNRTMIV